MKTSPCKSTSGNVLIVVLLVVFVVAIAATSYLALVNNQNNTVARSQAWNEAIPVCESGIEEALTQIHYWSGSFTATNNWTLGADGLYHKARTNSDGSYYAVGIVPTNPPTIYSTGFVRIPFNANSSNFLSRRVRVNTLQQPVEGIEAKGPISMSGGSYIDSFNSQIAADSSNGVYVASRRETTVQVVTDSSAQPAIAVGTGMIYGTAVTGATGTVTGNTPTGGTANNANVQINDVTPPFTNGITPTLGTVGGTNYTYCLGNGNYILTGSINIGGGCAIYVNGNPSILYCTGGGNNGFTVSGSGYIYIATNSSLKIYLNEPGTFSGSGIVNGSGFAGNCYLYGTTNCTSITYSGSSAFIGVVDAPEAAFTYSGSADFSGALTADTVLFSGGANFHYDNGLNTSNQVVASWNEF